MMNTQSVPLFGAVPVNVIAQDDDKNTSSENGSSNVACVVQKPQRPLSAYNLFFRMLRDRLLNEAESGKGATEKITAEQVAQISTQRRYANEKRCHRKSHGKYGFKEMTNIIINKWKNLDDETRQMFEVRAVEEKEKYVKAMKFWTESPLGKKSAANKTSAQKSCSSTSKYETSKITGKRKNIDKVESLPSACGSSNAKMNARRFAGSYSKDASAHANNSMPHQTMIMAQKAAYGMPPHGNLQMQFAHSHHGNSGSAPFGHDDHFGYSLDNADDLFEEALYATEDAFVTAQNFMNQVGHSMMNENMMDMNIMDINMMMMMMQPGVEDVSMYDDFELEADFHDMSFDNMMLMRSPQMMMNDAVPSYPPSMIQQQHHSLGLVSAGSKSLEPQLKRRRLTIPGDEDNFSLKNVFDMH